MIKETTLGQTWWLTPTIPATQDTENSRRIIVEDQPRQKVSETPAQSNSIYNPSYVGGIGRIRV
jgi:hypothetical protein